MADVQITIVDQQDVQMAVVDQNDAQIALTPALDAQLALAAPAEAQIIAAAPTFQGAAVESIDDLSDVDTSGIVAGQILQWNGSKWVGVDFDAARYIAAVQRADGQALEPEVQDAINQFIMGCKSDGIWDAIKACCILAGARTLNGALIPLVGAAPTSFNFVAGDYDRKIGLIGNGSTKYLDSNRADNADPQDNAHLSVFVSSAGTGGTGVAEAYIGGGDATSTVSVRAIIRFNGVGSLTGLGTYNRFNNFNSAGSLNLTGFIGNTRNTSAAFISRASEVNTSITATSRATDSTSLGVFVERRDGATFGRYASCRLAFYSIGESLDLALLNSRVTQLMTRIASALPLDVDAAAYISAVEAADGQSLELGVQLAVERFVVGCKTDGTWSAIKASCILAGARTLAGALVPLAGTAPTNNNFVSGDYSRTTGLVGDGSTKYLDSNRAENADPQNSHHMSFYVTEVATSGSYPMLGESSYAANTSLTGIYFYLAATPYQYNLRSRNVGGSSERLGDANTKFVAMNRSSSTQFTARADTSTATFNVASVTPKSDTYYIYSRNAGAIDSPGNQRMAFYSIGESLDLALLDNRVTRLVNEVAFYLNTGLDPAGYDIDTLKYINAGYAAGGSLS